MIETFGNRLAEDLFFDRRSKATRAFPPDVLRTARRKLLYLHDAAELGDLRAPPGNRLEALKGRWSGYHSIRITATFWAITVISFIDRVNRILFMAVASGLACASYVWFGLVDNPFTPAMYVAAVFLGIGEMSGILASQALVGQVAPERGRGAVIGVFTLCGSLGIFLAAIVGGTLFDIWRPSAPYIVIGCTSGLLCLLSIYTWWRTQHNGRLQFGV